jgi:hypothetical protein
LSNSNPTVRIAALGQVLNYGEVGLDLVIQALNDESLQVQDAAYSFHPNIPDTTTTIIMGYRHRLG